MLFDRELVPVRPTLRRPFQGWRYLDAEDAPPDLKAGSRDSMANMPAAMRKELDQAVNRVTADALKEKAAQIGQIKSLSEDAATGSMTIVLEV